MTRGVALVLGWLALAPVAIAQPAVLHPVNDHAVLLDDAEERALEALLLAHRRRTGVQLAVLLVRSTDGAPIDDYALRAAEAWAGGRAGVDDGVLFVMAVDQHDMKLEVGYGLEEAIPDSVALHILQSAQDDFRAERWAAGIRRVADGVIARTGAASPRAPSAATPAPPPRAIPGIGAGPWIVAAALVAGAIVVALLILRRRRT